MTGLHDLGGSWWTSLVVKHGLVVESATGLGCEPAKCEIPPGFGRCAELPQTRCRVNLGNRFVERSLAGVVGVHRGPITLGRPR